MVAATTATLFDNCEPWPDIVSGASGRCSVEATAVIAGNASPPYGDPVAFFSRTYPTPGLRALLAAVCGRLAGHNTAGPVTGLHAPPGGGKTHGLAALIYLARNQVPRSQRTEFIGADVCPPTPVPVALLDGEVSDPSRGTLLGDGTRVQTPWGEVAYQLLGRRGLERIEHGDRPQAAPPVTVLRDLLGDAPALILLDRLTVIWRRCGRAWSDGGSQIALFVKNLLAAVSSTPRTALVYTLAIHDDPMRDPYREENDRVLAVMRAAHADIRCLQIAPVRDSELIAALRRSLFKTIRVPSAATYYPLHPRAFEYLRAKISAVNTCHIFGGMLAVVARSIQNLWQARHSGVSLIDVPHLDFTPVIERLAYQHWEQRGRPEGSADADWIRAQREFREQAD